jgi:ParB family chromosome partitioning protein
MIKAIPLNKLVPSPRNVRRATDEQADLQLKADIFARGLLQNLVVTKASRPRGCYAVEAGGRRLCALQRLAQEEALSATHEVFCLVVEDGEAGQEASLAENFQRLSMNPADECLAFQQLIERGSDVEGIARRFGLTSRFVEGRLRLAGLASVVFEALGSGDISLEVAKAYAATPDRERQAYVFDQMGRGYGASHPDSIRRMMTQATASATDRRARFVGEEAYVAAGGRIERDLFADDAATRWLDIALLERLAGEKLERLAADAAAETGLAWVRPTLESWVGPDQTEGLHRITVGSTSLTEDESERVDMLEGEIEGLVELLEDEEVDDAAREAAEARVRELSDQIEAITTKPPVVEEALRASAGAFLVLDEHGRPKIDATLYTDAPPPVDASAAAVGEIGPDRLQKNGGLSQRLVDELSVQRRDILAVHVASDPALALDLAIFLMVDREAGYSRERSGSSLVAMAPNNPVLDFKTPDAAATIARSEAVDALDRSWTGGDTRAARFDAFRALPEEARGGWLAHAVSRTLEASLNLPGDLFCGFHDHLAQIIGIDVARWWRPTGANYFDRVPKGITLEALAEIGGDALAARYAKARKAELAQSCERIFSGDFIAEVEIKEAALAWVPEVMRFARGAASPGATGAAQNVQAGLATTSVEEPNAGDAAEREVGREEAA